MTTRINAGSHMEALPGTTLVAHALPDVARSRVSDTRDCHGIGQRRLLSPPHLGLMAGYRHFRYQRTERRRTDSYRPFPRGRYRRRCRRRYPSICRDPEYAKHLPKAQIHSG
jgi:hypothetical protein